jgi:FkbM family methyltransferase
MIIFKPHEIFSYVKPYLSHNPIIIEAGAFKGNDTIRLAQQWPEGTVYAFEPVPELYQQLVITTQPYPNIHCYQLALSDKNGTAEFYVSEKPTKPGKPSQAGSLLAPKERLKHSPLQFPHIIHVTTITLDSWAKENNIDHIDFAWLDLQGLELAVLQAAPTMLKTIKILYLEVGFIEGYAGQPTYPIVKQWLEKESFQEIGKDFTNTTDWFFGNCLFVRKN